MTWHCEEETASRGMPRSLTRTLRPRETEYDTARDPAYSGVAGMRDLVAELVATVHEVQVSAGEETGL
jgi:hypothetical protein